MINERMRQECDGLPASWLLCVVPWKSIFGQGNPFYVPPLTGQGHENFFLLYKIFQWAAPQHQNNAI